jgi:CRP/FNR family transcriptional regulator
MNRNKISAFQQTELFRDLDEKTLRLIAENAVERWLKRNEILFIAGEEAENLFVIAAGAIRAFRTGDNGREQIVHIERAHSTIGELSVFDDGVYPATAAAEENSIVYILDKNEIRRLFVEHPQIAMSALRVLSCRLRSAVELIETLSLIEVRQRLARLLLIEAGTNGKRIGENQIQVELNLTKAQIAARIGTVREVVSRLMTRFQTEELISLENNVLTIRDEKGLSNCSGELQKSRNRKKSANQ